MNLKEHTLPRSLMVEAWRRRDANFDGLFFLAVRTTGIYCRPSCPSSPQECNIEFFLSQADATHAGYRACKRCLPDQSIGTSPQWVTELVNMLRSDPTTKFDSKTLLQIGISPSKARRWFMAHHGVSFATWQRQFRLSKALDNLKSGQAIDDAIYNSGYESASGFRDAFRKLFHHAPSSTSRKEKLSLDIIDSPLGCLTAVTSEASLRFLEFSDRRSLPELINGLKKRFDATIIQETTPFMERVREQLAEYFNGKRREFEIPISPPGSTFQQKVWSALGNIRYGSTASYESIARALGNHKAVRAVARANATNPIYIIIPCHRIISKNGTLNGYAGGVWRKQKLLQLESKP